MEVNVAVSPDRNGSFIKGDDVTLTCTGVNPPDAVLRDLTFLWVGLLNNMEGYVDLTNGGGITVTTTGNTSTLSIMNIQDEMRIEGNYTCRVFNRVLTDVVEVTTEIDVICEMCVVFCLFVRQSDVVEMCLVGMDGEEREGQWGRGRGMEREGRGREGGMKRRRRSFVCIRFLLSLCSWSIGDISIWW